MGPIDATSRACGPYAGFARSGALNSADRPKSRPSNHSRPAAHTDPSQSRMHAAMNLIQRSQPLLRAAGLVALALVLAPNGFT